MDGAGNNDGKWQREYVTPHRVALLVVIKEVCGVKRQLNDKKDGLKDGPYTPERIRRLVREFSIAILHLVQVSDIEAPEFLDTVTKFLPEKTLNDCMEQLASINHGGVSSLMDYILALDSLIGPRIPVSDVNRSSILGMFIRRMLLAFDKLSFSNVTELYHDYQKYCMSMTAGQLSTCREDTVGWYEGNISVASHRQAELFVARQGALLLTNECEALPPKELRRQIEVLLRDEPRFAEAHFLNYMNSVRVKEYCDAIHSIHHSFDCSVNVADAKSSSSASNDECSRNFRFAALNLAILLHSFGHNKEAEESLNDAIRMAQDATDHVCLQHALSWLCRLSNNDALVERSISKSCELGLPYLASTGILKYSQIAALNGHKPTGLFEFMSKSDFVNCQHSMLELTCASYNQKANLWDVYGKRGMSSLCTQLLLNLNTCNPSLSGVHLNSESHCLALCRIARLLAEEGDYAWALTVIEQTARQFPQLTSYSSHWMIEESGIRFRRALLRGQWADAEAAVESLAAFSSAASDISHVELLAHKGNLPVAHEVVHKLLQIKRAKVDNPVHYRVRLLLLSCDVHCRARDFASALPAAIEAMALCRQQHFSYLEALATAHLANVKLHLGVPTVSLKLLCSRMRTLLSHGPPYDRHRVMFLYHKCRVEAVKSTQMDERSNSVLVDVAHSLTSVAEGFLKIEAFHRAKEVFHTQAVLYHKLGLQDECNSAAFKFRLADLQCNGTATLHWEGRL